jgi:hypothetical protein
MQAQEQKMKGEVIAQINGKTDSWSIKDVSSNGFKLENNDVGQITGKYSANFMETITVNMKQDGSNDWEGKGLQMAGTDLVVTTSKGKGHTGAQGMITFEGDMNFMTKSSKLAWLNNTKGWIEGQANQQSQTFTATVYAKK